MFDSHLCVTEHLTALLLVVTCRALARLTVLRMKVRVLLKLCRHKMSSVINNGIITVYVNANT